MSNLKMMHNKLFDAATISTIANELMPLTNVQMYDNSEAFRTDTLENVVIKIQLANPAFISGLVLWRHNLSSTATIQWKGYASTDYTGDAIIDTGVVLASIMKPLIEFVMGIDSLGATIYDDWDDDKRATEFWQAEKAIASQEIIINDPDNTFGFIDVTRIFNGLAISPKTNFSEGANMKLVAVDNGGITTSDASYHTVKSDTYRKAKFSLNWLKDVDIPLFISFNRQVGVHDDFYISMYPEAAPQKRRNHAFCAKFTTLLDTTNVSAGRYSSPVELREA